MLLGLLGLLLLLLLLLVLLLLCKLDLALFSSWSVAFGCFVSVFLDSEEWYQLQEHCWAWWRKSTYRKDMVAMIPERPRAK